MNDDLFNSIDNYLKNPNQDKEKLLSDEEVERLILSLAITRGEEGFHEEEALAVVRWAEGVRIGQTMLKFVLDGICDIDWKQDDVAISLTEFGKRVHEDSKEHHGLN